MSRTYKSVRVKHHRVYSVAETMQLYKICRNTLSNWVGSGLQVTGGKGPQLFRGAELKRFHAARKSRTKRELRRGEFKCFRCKSAVFPEPFSLEFSPAQTAHAMATATCPDCGVGITKLLDETECDSLRNCFNTNTSLYSIDEDKGAGQARVGKISRFETESWHSANDRTIHDWLMYARRFSDKTIDAHLHSIREFERFFEGKAFDKVTLKDVGSYRDALVQMGNMPKNSGGLSSSTMRHRVSQLTDFFKWLQHQEGFRRLSTGIPGYLVLPKGAVSKPLTEDSKPFPLIEDATEMVLGMPHGTLLERRDRAMVAFAFISGLRAGALTSLRFKHLDIKAKEVIQDGHEMRAKNGKSFRVFWFPRTEAMQKVFCEWVTELQWLGFEGEDAVFPRQGQLGVRKPIGATIEPMHTEAALSAAFANASKGIGKNYSPHSARHCLAALGNSLCLTPERRKAWSLNLGHETEVITETHYAKMPDHHRSTVIDGLRSQDVWTDDEKDLLLDYHHHKLVQGTPEFRRAKALFRKREGAWNDDLAG